MFLRSINTFPNQIDLKYDTVLCILGKVSNNRCKIDRSVGDCRFSRRVYIVQVDFLLRKINDIWRLAETPLIHQPIEKHNQSSSACLY